MALTHIFRADKLSVPDLAGLRLGSGRAKQQIDEGLSVPGKEGPEITISAEGGRGEDGKKHQAKADPKAGNAAEKDAKDQKHAIEP